MAESKLSNEDKACIIRWYGLGMYSQQELADLFKVSRATIRRALQTRYEPDLDPDRPTDEDPGRPILYPTATDENVDGWDGPEDRPTVWPTVLAVATGFALTAWAGYILVGAFN